MGAGPAPAARAPRELAMSRIDPLLKRAEGPPAGAIIPEIAAP